MRTSYERSASNCISFVSVLVLRLAKSSTNNCPLTNRRTPPLPATPSAYFPESGATSLPVQRTEKLSLFTCGAGLNDPQSKLTWASVLTRTGSPLSSRLLKYSPFKPVCEPLLLSFRDDEETGSTIVPVWYRPGE